MNEFNLIELLAQLGVQYVPFLFALCFHEFAHGFVAKKKGDNTAELMGRLTMNPFAHADLIGTFVLPLVGILAGMGGMNGGHGYIFGWAKPVPVNTRNFKHPVNDMFWVALAGPLSNILLAAIAILLLPFVGVWLHDPRLTQSLETILANFVVINVLLAVFNMIPLHPLDGGKVIARFLPVQANRWLEDNQSVLQWALVVFFIAGGFSILKGPMVAIIQILESGASVLTGLIT